jgi:hypothetical protein
LIQSDLNDMQEERKGDVSFIVNGRWDLLCQPLQCVCVCARGGGVAMQTLSLHCKNVRRDKIEQILLDLCLLVWHSHRRAKGLSMFVQVLVMLTKV